MAVMEDKRAVRTFANGVPEMLILQLVSRDEMYGYQLVKAIRESSGGKLEYAEGHIYPLLHSMESRGHLASRRREVNGKTRLYYRITPKGKDKLKRMRADWLRLKDSVEAVVGPIAA